LLGRTEVKKADASKQAAAGYLGLSEGAIYAICDLKCGLLEQRPLRDYKPEFNFCSLHMVLSAWIETVDLSKLMGNLYKLLMATAEYNTSGLSPEKYIMSDEQKRVLYCLKRTIMLFCLYWSSLITMIKSFNQSFASPLMNSPNKLKS